MMKFKPSTKIRIKTPEEMMLFLHMKRKGVSCTKNKKQYNRKPKHKADLSFD